MILEPNVSEGILDTLDAIALCAEEQGLFDGETLLVARCPEDTRHIPCLKRRREIRIFGRSFFRKECILLSIDNRLHEDRKLRAAFFDKRIMDIAIKELTAFAETIEATFEYREFTRSAGA